MDQNIINDDTSITQILYNKNLRHYDTMVTILKLEITVNVSKKLSLEEVKKAYRTVHASIKQNHARDKRNETALFTRNGAITPGRVYTKLFKGSCKTCGQKRHKLANCW
jgi:ArsR family metal-binding transcriptional regulator